MTHRVLTLCLFFATVATISTSVAAQSFDETEMYLSPVEVEDVVQPEPIAVPERSDFERSDLLSLEDDTALVPSELEDLMVEEPESDDDNSPPKKSDSQRRAEATAGQIAQLRTPLSEINLTGVTPVSQLGFTTAGEQWISASMDASEVPTTTSTRYSRRRLYFEEASLERCGRSTGYFDAGIWINGKSAAKFLLDTTLLPYRMLRKHPDELVGALAK